MFCEVGAHVAMLRAVTHHNPGVNVYAYRIYHVRMHAHSAHNAHEHTTTHTSYTRSIHQQHKHTPSQTFTTHPPPLDLRMIASLLLSPNFSTPCLKSQALTSAQRNSPREQASHATKRPPQSLRHAWQTHGEATKRTQTQTDPDVHRTSGQ